MLAACRSEGARGGGGCDSNSGQSTCQGGVGGRQDRLIPGRHQEERISNRENLTATGLWLTMTDNLKPRRPEGQDGTLSSLNVAIDALNLAKEASGATLAKAAFDSTSFLLTKIRVSFLPVHVG